MACQEKRPAQVGLASWVHQQRPLSGSAATRGGRKYTEREKLDALGLAYEVGPTAAGRQLGISKYTIAGWLDKSRRDMRAAMALVQKKEWWDL